MLPKTLGTVALGLTAVAGIVSVIFTVKVQALIVEYQPLPACNNMALPSACKPWLIWLRKHSNKPAALNGHHFCCQGQQGHGQQQGQGWGYGPRNGNGHGQPGRQEPSSFTCSALTGPSGIATSAAVTITPATTKLTVIATGISSSTDVATLTASANSPTYSTI
ncbi:hypothetical protein B0J17DRAFT_714358 [Rhizoctonia solani]|nr:hypothetical protein B0J17DRAFT_714358 [Rhizoctonia solani]